MRTRILITNEKMTGLIFFLVLISAVDMRHEFERPSRIVAIKQGRIQGKVRDLPLQGVSSSGDDIDDTYRYDIKIEMISHSHFHHIIMYVSFRVRKFFCFIVGKLRYFVGFLLLLHQYNHLGLCLL